MKMPSMILQPIVENAVRHGIRGVEENGTILLTVHGDVYKRQMLRDKR